MAGARAASEKYICSTPTIPRKSTAGLLLGGAQLKVPMLQRRYCWGQAQLNQLLRDVLGISDWVHSVDGQGKWLANINYGIGLGVVSHTPLAARGGYVSEGHSLGRVMASTIVEPGKVLVLDGQQRITSTCLTLASLRDVVREAAAETPNADPKALHWARDFQDQINRVLFPHAPDLDQLLADARAVGDRLLAKGGEEADEEEEGEGGNHSPLARMYQAVALLPTLLDRKAFLACTVPCPELAERLAAAASVASHPEKLSNVLVAKRQLMDSLRGEGGVVSQMRCKMRGGGKVDLGLGGEVRACAALAYGLMVRCNVLFFDAREEDVWSVYERLAFRELMLSKQFQRSEDAGIFLGEADLARNYLVSFFPSEQEQLRAYRSFWLPIEAAACVDGANRLDRLFTDFNAHVGAVSGAQLIQQEQNVAGYGGAVHLQISAYTNHFPTFRGLRAVVEGRLAQAGIDPTNTTGSQQACQIAEDVLREIADFSRTWSSCTPPSTRRSSATTRR